MASQMNFAARANNDSFSSSDSTQLAKARRPGKKTASFLTRREGYLLKKSSKSRFGVSVWQKRYFVLAKGKLMVYNTPEEYNSSNPREKAPPSKTVDLSHVTNVAFHYSRNAPVKSKRLFTSQFLEESRFDIYTPTRTFMLKAENNDIKDSGAWVSVLKESVDFLA